MGYLMAICSYSIAVAVRAVSVQYFLDSFSDSVDTVLETIYYRFPDGGGGGAINGGFDTIGDSLGGASGGRSE